MSPPRIALIRLCFFFVDRVARQTIHVQQTAGFALHDQPQADIWPLRRCIEVTARGALIRRRQFVAPPSAQRPAIVEREFAGHKRVHTPLRHGFELTSARYGKRDGAACMGEQRPCGRRDDRKGFAARMTGLK
jgi:hypothetical protein